MGTRCAPSWDTDWIAAVEAREARIGRRICGARTLGGTPCPMGSKHESGRCPHHGGFDLTGAPKGNRNAVVHGLYSQRLGVCGRHCPMWRRCPMAGDHVLGLEPKERPLCPYEQQLYEVAVTDELGEVASWGDSGSPLDRHIAHEGALHRVMLWRAAAAMAETPLIESHPQRDNERPSHDKVHAYTEAYLRIAREQDRWRRTMDMRRRTRRIREDDLNLPDVDTITDHLFRQDHDTRDESDEMRHNEPDVPEKIRWAHRLGVHAMAASTKGNDTRALAALSRASVIANAEADLIASEVLASYRPIDRKYAMSHESIAAIAGHWGAVRQPMNEVTKELAAMLRGKSKAPP